MLRKIVVAVFFGLLVFAIFNLGESDEEHSSKDVSYQNQKGVLNERGHAPVNGNESANVQSNQNALEDKKVNLAIGAGKLTQDSLSLEKRIARRLSQKVPSANLLSTPSGKIEPSPALNEISLEDNEEFLSVLKSTNETVRKNVRKLEELRSSGSLNSSERQAALDYLRSVDSPTELSRPYWHWFVDELITTLRADSADNAEVSRVLAEIVTNEEHDGTVRDYAAQHLGHLQSEGGDLGVIEEALKSVTLEKSGTLAGTALLALNQSNDEIEVGEIALRLISDSSVDLRSRMTALQVAGKHNISDVLPIAVEIAGDMSLQTSLRMTAIATISDFEDLKQRPFLEKLTQEAEPRIRNAANIALTALSDKS